MENQDQHRRKNSVDTTEKPATEKTLKCTNNEGKEKTKFYNGPVSLPTCEAWFYIITWIGCYAMFFYSVYNTSNKFSRELNQTLSKGWDILGGHKDNSNYEWRFWSTLFPLLAKVVIPHIIIGQAFRFFPAFYKWRSDVFLVHSITCLIWLIGPLAAGCFFLQCAVFYAASLTGSKLLIWLVALAQIAFNNNYELNSKMESLNWDPEFYHGYFMITADFALNIIKGTSAALVLARTKQWQTDGHFKSIRKIFTFMFYVPNFYCGPLLNYDQFQKEINKPYTPFSRATLKSLLSRAIRIAFWWIFIEFWNHFIYQTALQNNRSVMRSMNLWSLAGVGYLQGIFFMMKYVIMFGLPSFIAKLDDIDTPSFPKCVATSYLFSEVWKGFDNGLYNFMRDHIYIAVGGSKKGWFRQLLGSFLCFSYVFFWHGGDYYLFVWAALNNVGIILEFVGTKVTRLPFVQKLESQYFSLENSRRIRALFGAPMLVLSLYGTFYFFGGAFMANTIFNRIMIDGYPIGPLTVIFCFYCSVQTCMEVQLRGTKAVKDKKA